MLTLSNFNLKVNQHALFLPINIQVSPGTICCVMAPSGGGKSSLLSAIAGTLPSAITCSGSVKLGSTSLLTLPTHKRHVGLMFQDDLLFPHFNVAQNLAFALPHKLSRKEKAHAIADALAVAQLDGYQTRDIATLSGGQKARIALLRTILAAPNLLLLDEPFAKLDQALRQDFRQFLTTQVQQLNVPALLVTHDPQDTQGCQLLELAQG
ncbi:ATP-binding cassette domain-containing protein [Motilimonas pumila]|uniref:ATP-binding cassette domain-containing protein n=1 Tax=Motilimonas pumila TaxID=2303987 RepID=A0A418YDB3_9GAMM|nr:ATP-binding cassette domain-containing protein [Motilimonas pumila]RJG42529.1 ATP-binding cassette domain-containing protein [Motilimonas pumila]